MLLKQSIRNNDQHSESGAVVLFAGALIVACLTFLSYLLLQSAKSSARSELQAATDAAAHAGAATLCATNACFENARVATVEALRRQQLSQLVHGTNGLPITIHNHEVGNEVRWLQPNYEVQIERGVWDKNANDEWFFDSQEDAYAWQTLNPALPLLLVTNAVKVKVTYTAGLPSFLRAFPISFSVETESVAISDAIQTVCAPPMAIPICSLLDQDGHFDVANIAKADRIFAQADRFCPSTHPDYPNCQFFPRFPIEPVTPDATTLVGPWQYPPPHWFASTRNDTMNYYSSPRFRQTSDHYAVLGLPQASVNQTLIRQAFLNGQNGRGCTSTRKGDNFFISPNGFGSQVPDGEDILWSRINGSYPNVSLPFFNSPLNLIERNYWEIADCPSYMSSCNVPSTFDGYSGACNSRRYDHARAMVGNEISNRLTTPLWQVSVPVIADLNDSNFNCSAPDNVNDPVIQTARPWSVVGFVRMYIHDVDMGRAPDPAAMSEKREDLSGSSSIIVEPVPFGENCNVVRGRIAPDTNSIAIYPDDATTAPLKRAVLVK